MENKVFLSFVALFCKKALISYMFPFILGIYRINMNKYAKTRLSEKFRNPLKAWHNYSLWLLSFLDLTLCFFVIPLFMKITA